MLRRTPSPWELWFEPGKTVTNQLSVLINKGLVFIYKIKVVFQVSETGESRDRDHGGGWSRLKVKKSSVSTFAF